MQILLKFDLNITSAIFDVNIFFFYKRNICFTVCLKTWFSFVIDPLLSQYQYDKYYQSQNNPGKHALVQLSFSTKYLRLNNIESSTLNRCNSINVVSTLFCQRWNNVDKHTSTQLSFSTKYQRWNNVW